MALWKKWVLKGIVCALVAALVYTACYDIFRNRTKDYMTDSTVSENNIAWLYESTYILYKDLYNMVHGTNLDYEELYLLPDAGYEWILDEQYLNTQPTASPVEYDVTDVGTDETSVLSSQAGIEGVIGDLERFREHYWNVEESYEYLNHLYGYHIIDHTTGRVITNLSTEDMENWTNDFFRISFVFDEAGNVSVGEEIISTNEDMVRKYANGEIRENGGQNPIIEELSTLNHYVTVVKPVNCTVTFSITGDARENMKIGGFDVYSYGRGDYGISRYVDASMRYVYEQAGAGHVLTALFFLVCLLGFVLNCKVGAEYVNGIRTLFTSVEFLLAGGFLWYGVGGRNIVRWVASVAEGDAANILKYAMNGRSYVASILVHGANLLILLVFFMGAWYVGYCVSEWKICGIRQYIRRHSIVYRFFPYTKRKCVEAYEKVANIDLTKDANKTIVRLLVVNGIILLAISSLWIVGWVVILVYSLILYVVLRKYISDLQKRYGILLNATNEIAKGNLNVSIEENLGVFEPFKPEITKIQEGFKNAVEEEMKSQRMKSELITNVSHDLKTPLTAIITYINLLKEKNITEEQRAEYLDTLERKSLRLKVLIEDLFEVSKASSNNVTLNIMDVDIMNLVKQVSFEMTDKMEAANLDVRLNLPEGRVTLPLDSQKTYRVYENLFGNVAKYAMPGTRVYVSGALRDGRVEIILKNITAQEITVDSAELTERFVRNDTSRNTEGSGLGLAIAKSFMELQGGELNVEVDGDLFKATTSWPVS